MSRKVTIALDAMGGDRGPAVVVPAALATLEKDDSVNLILVGLADVLEQVERQTTGKYGKRLKFRAATEVVGMDEHPGDVLRHKKDSSLRVAIELVKTAEADACVSSGNTGALMATARYVLKTLPGIDRPAIISAVPGLKSPTFMLDIGANVGCTADHLVQFALMGSVIAAGILDIEKPRVGLLNIGEEDIKGNEVIREAGNLLSHSGLNYQGFVEGDGIFHADVDVVVSDGLVGNVAIKTMEGVAGLIGSFLREEFRRSSLRRLQGIAANAALDALRARLDARRYNGASLVGLNGVVLKSHGGADQLAFETAVQTAIVEARKGVPVRIGELLGKQSRECIRA
ncbi:phosphate acyltransferase PlsX [Candidatus Rariloculus sp.]|uniref:phosphate acyltransferase PlsX n=1 Tax=Candidatus Rariloculus sp. TaxID=3101265 RepID=UPI003D0E9F77